MTRAADWALAPSTRRTSGQRVGRVGQLVDGNDDPAVEGDGGEEGTAEQDQPEKGQEDHPETQAAFGLLQHSPLVRLGFADQPVDELPAS
jgi:hypothetical protein